ncbi:MAG: hypothetical protein MJ221_01340 [Bacilli bacterium]|nr:hypothetical protein [Bacilli bacterium]
MIKEKSMKIGNKLLLSGLMLETISIMLFFLPFKSNIMGLEVALGKDFSVFALISFILIVVSIVMSLLIFVIKNFPWGKILLVALSVFCISAATVLFFINEIAFGAIIVSIINYISAALLFIASLLK